MEIELTAEQEAKLARIASYEGTSVEEIARVAVLDRINRDAEFDAGLERARRQADQGEFISHDKVKARFREMIRRR